MAKKYVIPGILVVLIFVTWLALGSDTSESAVIYTTPQSGSFNVTVTTTGELRAQSSTNVRGPEGMREFRIFNVTIQSLVPEGTVVQKGDLVAELDRSQVLSSLQDAQLELEEAESEYEIAQLDSSLTLSEARDNLINLEYSLEEQEIAVEQSRYESPAVQRQAQIDLERARRQLEQAHKNYLTRQKQAEARLREINADLLQERREVDRIQQMMKEFTIYAPENGMVIYRRQRNGSKISEGSEVSAWDPVVAELPDFSVMESVTYVNEVDIQKIRVGQRADIGLDAMPDKRLSGVVTNVANIGEQRPNSDSKVFQVIVRINESDSTLRPSMTTSNLIYVDSMDNAIFVSLESVHTEDSLNYVFKREGLDAVKQQVILGMMNENQIVIHEGVSMGDQLYLSTPSDTSGISMSLLPDEIVAKYRQNNGTPSTEQEQTELSQPMDGVSDNLNPRLRQNRE